MYNFGALFSFIFYIEDVLKNLTDSINLEEDPDEFPTIKMVEVGKYSSFKTVRTDGGNDTGELLADIGVYISSLLSDLQNYQKVTSPNDLFLMNYDENCLDFLKTNPTGKCGADVVFVNRNEHNLILLTDRSTPYNIKNSGQNNTSKSISKRILSLACSSSTYTCGRDKSKKFYVGYDNCNEFVD